LISEIALPVYIKTTEDVGNSVSISPTIKSLDKHREFMEVHFLVAIDIKLPEDIVEVEVVPLDNVFELHDRVVGLLLAEVLVLNALQPLHDDLPELIQGNGTTVVSIEFVEQVLTFVVGDLRVHTSYHL
jgi:hypothetical protein